MLSLAATLTTIASACVGGSKSACQNFLKWKLFGGVLRLR